MAKKGKSKESKPNPKKSKQKPDDSKQLSKDSKKKGGSSSHTSNKSSEKHGNQKLKKSDEPAILPRTSRSKEGKKNRKHVKDLSNEQPNHSDQQIPKKQASGWFQKAPKNPSKIAKNSKAPIEEKISSSNLKNHAKRKSRSKDPGGSKQHEKKGVLFNDRQGNQLVSNAETVSEDPSKDSQIKKSDKLLKSCPLKESEKPKKDLKLKEGFKPPNNNHKKKERSRKQKEQKVSEKPFISVVCVNIYL